jgi:hypothetical protein
MVDIGVGASWTCSVDDGVICVRSIAGVLQTISDALLH